MDVLRIIFSDEKIKESDEDKPRAILDYDVHGNIVGMEILHASKRVEKPSAIEFEIAM